MKNIFKKNQIIITALAVMIAVAGYLNYSGSKLGRGSHLYRWIKTASKRMRGRCQTIRP